MRRFQSGSDARARFPFRRPALLRPLLDAALLACTLAAMSSFRTRRTLKPAAMDAARPVEPEFLRELLTDASWAPTHGLTQPWRFDVFTGAARARLAAALQGLYDETTPAATRNEDKRAKLGQSPLQAPVVIAVTARVIPGGKISELDEICATAASVQNLLLSATDHGLGSFWATPPVAVSPAFVAWLGLDATHRSLGLVYLGWPAQGKPAPISTRDPLDLHAVFHES